MKRGAKAVLLGVSIGVAAILAVVGFVFLVQLRNLETKQASQEREFIAMNGRVTELERIARQIATQQSGPGSRNLSAPSTKKDSISLTDSETQILRSFIKIAPPQTTTQPVFKVGDALTQSASLPMPQAIVEKLSKLEGSRFAIDQSGAIAISGAGEDRVGIVIAAPTRPAPN